MRGRDPLIVHYVHDMQRATNFYVRVFDVQPAFTSSGWSTLDFGAIELALHVLDPRHNDEAPLPHAGLNLLVNNIEEMAALIADNGGVLTELREPDDFVPVRVASFQDPEGNGFELRQAV